MTEDPWDDPGAKRWVRRVVDELVPMIDKSVVTMTLVTNDKVDVRFAVELGLCIMMDKPIIALVMPGARIPPKLALVMDGFVEGDPADPRMADRIAMEFRRVIEDKGLLDD